MDLHDSPGRLRMRAHALVLAAVVILFSSCSASRPGVQPGPPPPQTAPAHAPRADSLFLALDQLLRDSALAPATIGLKVVSLEDGKVLFEHNASKLFHPASNQKILTTAAALALLPREFTFVTRFAADGRISPGTLRGNLRVRGSGDPLLTSLDLDSAAAAIRAAGIRRITGDLIGDASYFDTLTWGKGWMWDDEPDADEAFISPLTVDDNAVRVTVRPARRSGRKPFVSVEPPTRVISVQNDAVTSGDTAIAPLEAVRSRGSSVIGLRGRMPIGGGPEEFLVSVPRPELMFLDLLRQRLAAHGVAVAGSLRTEPLFRGKEITTLFHPLDSAVDRINKVSDNIGAENLLKSLAAERSGAPGTAAAGTEVVKGFLAYAGIDTLDLTLVDGSGVSFYNAVSPDAIVRVLTWLHNDSVLFHRFLASLPIAGVDGTLKLRMRGSAAEGNVFAKTGSLTGVSALSGYVRTRGGKLLAFSLLYNEVPGENGLAREHQDRIVNVLYGSPSGGNKKSPPHVTKADFRRILPEVQ